MGEFSYCCNSAQNTHETWIVHPRDMDSTPKVSISRCVWPLSFFTVVYLQLDFDGGVSDGHRLAALCSLCSSIPPIFTPHHSSYLIHSSYSHHTIPHIWSIPPVHTTPFLVFDPFLLYSHHTIPHIWSIPPIHTTPFLIFDPFLLFTPHHSSYLIHSSYIHTTQFLIFDPFLLFLYVCVCDLFLFLHHTIWVKIVVFLPVLYLQLDFDGRVSHWHRLAHLAAHAQFLLLCIPPIHTTLAEPTVRFPVYRRFLYKEHTSTHAQGTDPRVALGA